MPGFGSGLAHAITQGLTGYQEGSDEQMRKMLALEAQRRAEARAQEQAAQSREGLELKRLETLGQLAAMGYDVGEPQVAVKDTASVRTVNNENPTSPEAGAANPSPAEPSQDGRVIGAVQGRAIRVPPGGLVGKAARDDAQKQAQRIKERYAQLEAAQESITDPNLKKTPTQLRTIATNDVLYNKYIEQASGLATDPVEQHKQMRLFDVNHPTRNTSTPEPSWQVVTAADGTMWQVNPKTGEKRSLDLQGRVGKTAGSTLRGGGQQTVAQKNKSAEIDTTIGTIDEAMSLLKAHPKSVNLLRGRGISDVVDQNLDPKGVPTRAAIASVSSNLLHALSGAAISPKEYQRLRQYVPTTTDTYDAAMSKLARLRSELERSRTNMGAGSDSPRSFTMDPKTGVATPDRVPSYEEWKRAKGVP